MLRLRVLDILKEQNHSKYWLYKQMDMSYQNFSRIVNNETSSIRYENLEKLSKILNCPVGDLFEQLDDISPSQQ
ncbi:MAG: helix-turn-helix transcriptional regulator [Lachnospiraceae bacterium]|nr:helix-turn-helix transcriptional regulator [Lachnospiraceae bacterium]